MPVWSINPRRLNDAEKMAQAISSSAEGLMHVQIDHFLWAGISENQTSDTLDLYATAALFRIGSGKQLWRNKAHGRGWESHPRFGLYGPELSMPAQSLASGLFANLPPVQ